MQWRLCFGRRGSVVTLVSEKGAGKLQSRIYLFLSRNDIRMIWKLLNSEVHSCATIMSIRIWCSMSTYWYTNILEYDRHLYWLHYQNFVTYRVLHSKIVNKLLDFLYNYIICTYISIIYFSSFFSHHHFWCASTNVSRFYMWFNNYTNNNLLKYIHTYVCT